MSLRKIDDVTFHYNQCQSPEHNPPKMVSLSPGTYEWTCPACGHRQIFIVDGLFFDTRPKQFCWEVIQTNRPRFPYI